MKILAKCLVGSRLHGLDTKDSDYDYRGIHITNLRDYLSPFSKSKSSSWFLGDNQDNTSYELADFCKLATKGNATILEIFFSDQIITTSPAHQEMRDNWTKFIDTRNFVEASRGYARNQWKKMYNFDDIGEKEQERTAKFAVAFLRVMWQCSEFLTSGEFKCNLKEADIYPLVKAIKPLDREQIQPLIPEIVSTMGEMDRRVTRAMATSPYIDMKPDIKWIEDFIYRTYINEQK